MMRRAMMLMLGLVWCAMSWAMPPRPGTGVKDPTLGHPVVERPNPDAYTVVKGEDGEQVIISTLSKGTKKYPVILIGFTDRSWNIPKARFDSLLFVPNSMPTGSLTDYFREVSYGKDTISGHCYGWYQSGQTQAYYGAGSYGLQGAYPRNAAGLVMRACSLAYTQINFSQYSCTGNKLDLLIVVHAGPGAEGGIDGPDPDNMPDSTNWIWSHNAALSGWGVPPARRTFGGIIIDQYTMQPEISALDTTYRTKQIEIGVFAHELGHALGLPDLYDVDGSSEGVGRYCLMSSGSWGVDYYNSTPQRPGHPSPWAKKFLGWITPEVMATDTAGLKLPPVQTTGKVLRLNTPAASEYFLIENRQKIGFDSLLDGEGLLIWHQDETVIANGYPNNQINTNETRKGVDVEQAKGIQSLDYPASPANWANRNRGDGKDFYPYLTNNHFADYTTPSSRNYSGASSGVAITSMAAGAGDTMVMNIGIPGFVIGLLQNPAFPQYLSIAAVSNSGLLRPDVLDTALMQNPSGSRTLAFSRIGLTRSYQVDYELLVTGTHTIRLAAKDSVDTMRVRRADRSFEVVSGKSAGSTVEALGGAVRLELTPGALSKDMLLAVVEAASFPYQTAYPLGPPIQLGPSLNLSEISQLSLRYDPQVLGYRDCRRLGVYRAEGGNWTYLGGTLDQAGNRVLAEVDRLGIYQLAWSPDNPLLPSLGAEPSSRAWPNPFKQKTTIKYQTTTPGRARLKIYNVAGQLVRELDQGHKAAGLHRAVWDGADQTGRAAASGVYLYRLEAGGMVQSGRMIKVK